MKKWTLLAAAAAIAAMTTTSAHAAPITTPPPTLTALGGDVKAIYVFANAGNTSFLDETNPLARPNIFCNHPSGTCTGNMAGDIADLGAQSGALVFSLRNVTSGKTYWTTTADGDGNYHAVISTDYSTFGLGPLPAGAASALSGLPNITFVAWEDLEAGNGSDFDYNDLVFAFSNTTPATPGVPEPMSLLLLGAGLIGLAGIRRSAACKQR